MAKKNYNNDEIDLMLSKIDDEDRKFSPNKLYTESFDNAANGIDLDISPTSYASKLRNSTNAKDDWAYSGQQYEGEMKNEINTAAKVSGVNPYLGAAIIGSESSFNPNAKSKAGAKGFAQLMPDTAKELGVDIDDPADNIKGGMVYMSRMLKKYDGNIDHALKAYNWGPGNMDAYLKTGKGAKGQVMPTETKEYASKVLSNYKKLMQE